MSKDVFLKNSDGSLYKGKVWPGDTVFPDWFHENTQSYWNNEFVSFFDPSTGVDIDALWIDMNEPSNFCDFPCGNPTAGLSTAAGSKKGLPGRDLLYPPYQIRNEAGGLSNKTVNTNVIHRGGWVEYDTHNL